MRFARTPKDHASLANPTNGSEPMHSGATHRQRRYLGSPTIGTNPPPPSISPLQRPFPCSSPRKCVFESLCLCTLRVLKDNGVDGDAAVVVDGVAREVVAKGGVAGMDVVAAASVAAMYVYSPSPSGTVSAGSTCATRNPPILALPSVVRWMFWAARDRCTTLLLWRYLQGRTARPQTLLVFNQPNQSCGGGVVRFYEPWLRMCSLHKRSGSSVRPWSADGNRHLRKDAELGGACQQQRQTVGTPRCKHQTQNATYAMPVATSAAIVQSRSMGRGSMVWRW